MHGDSATLNESLTIRSHHRTPRHILPRPAYPLDNYELLDRNRRESGRVFLTGTQALVRIPLMQRTLDANALAKAILGNTIYANVIMLGCAWQQGLVPVSLDALHRAIELNDVEVDNNRRAFSWGRIAAVDPERVCHIVDDTAAINENLDEIIKRRADFLVEYQNKALAERFIELVQRVRDTAAANDNLAAAVATSYFRLLSYKDEYEVARLHTQANFLQSLRYDFGDKAKLRFHLAPPLLGRQRDARGRPRKKEFGSWILPVFRLIAGMRGLRGTMFDLFGLMAERRMERGLISEFEGLVEHALAELTADTADQLQNEVALYMDIRGYGPVKEQALEEVRKKLSSQAA